MAMVTAEIAPGRAFTEGERMTAETASPLAIGGNSPQPRPA